MPIESTPLLTSTINQVVDSDTGEINGAQLRKQIKEEFDLTSPSADFEKFLTDMIGAIEIESPSSPVTPQELIKFRDELNRALKKQCRIRLDEKKVEHVVLMTYSFFVFSCFILGIFLFMYPSKSEINGYDSMGHFELTKSQDVALFILILSFVLLPFMCCLKTVSSCIVSCHAGMFCDTALDNSTIIRYLADAKKRGDLFFDVVKLIIRAHITSLEIKIKKFSTENKFGEETAVINIPNRDEGVVSVRSSGVSF